MFHKIVPVFLVRINFDNRRITGDDVLLSNRMCVYVWVSSPVILQSVGEKQNLC